MVQKKKICFFGIKYYPSRGGTSRVAENLIKNLTSKYDITIYCYKNKKALNFIKGVRVIQIPELPFRSGGVFFYYFLCAVHILFTGKYDLIHAHKTDCAFFLPLLTQKYRVICTSHEAPYLRDKWSFVGKTYFRLMERFFINSRATLTSISKPLSDYYFKRYQRFVKYIPNGVNLINTYSNIDAEKILKEFSIQGTYLLFAARRLMATKGCHTLLDALALIDSKVTLIIAGDTSQLPEYNQKLRSKSSKLNVKFIGYIDHLETLLALVQKSYLFIFPSETEGMSIMLLEVASVGTPLICSDIPENREVFNDDEVLFFKNKNVADLAEKLVWATNNMEEMSEKARKAKNKVSQVYSWKRIIGEYEILYENLIG